ncbi:MAG: flagellar biosynthesis protein FlhB [Rhodospirillales bacterium]|nr:flagellar biosynthesis protein FlhB [Rhodospirillales bacterium]
MAEGEETDDSQKTEDPSAKKLEESRRKGQVAISREVNNWVMLLAGTLVVGLMAPGLMTEMTIHLRGYIEHADDLPPPPGGFGMVLGGSLLKIMGILLLPLFFLMAAAFLGPFLQVGPIFAPQIISPDLSKISPLQGIRRLFSMRSIMEFVKGVLKIGLIGAVGAILIMPYFDGIEHMVGLPPALMLSETGSLFIRMMTGILVAFLLIAVTDLVYQRLSFGKRMRMSRQELKEEYRQSEGDPQIKSRLRALRVERAKKRMMQAVPNADVVITNPTHFAIALVYKPEEMEAPKCVAKGMDSLALKIREVAGQHGVEIVENPPLARALYDAVDIDQSIPKELYKAVAEVISYVFQKKGKLKPRPT